MSLNIGISAYGGVSATVSAAIVIPGVVVNNPVVPMRGPYRSECPRPWMLCAPANVALLLSPSAITAARYALLKPELGGATAILVLVADSFQRIDREIHLRLTAS